MKLRLTQKRINIIFGVSLIALTLYAVVATVMIISYKDSIDGSFWSGLKNDSEFRTQYQRHIEKYHPEEL